MRKKLLIIILIGILLVSVLIAVKAVVYQINPLRCWMCGRCTLHCPTGAIKFNENTGFLYIDTSLCNGCGVCVSYCPYGAIYQTTANSDDNLLVPKLQMQCFPNPMHSDISIKIILPDKKQPAILQIANAKGQIVYNASIDKSGSTLSWKGLDINGKKLPSGVYFATLRYDKTKTTQKITLVRK